MQQQKWHVQASFFFYLMHTQVFMLDYLTLSLLLLPCCQAKVFNQKNPYLANGLRSL